MIVHLKVLPAAPCEHELKRRYGSTLLHVALILTTLACKLRSNGVHEPRVVAATAHGPGSFTAPRSETWSVDMKLEYMPRAASAVVYLFGGVETRASSM